MRLNNPRNEKIMTTIIEELVVLIADRKNNPTATSYTVTLLNDLNKAAQKVGEEGVEVVVAALGQSDERLIEESADLIYHLLVLLAARDVAWSDVKEELAKRRR
jgi:phosphoribosyl-ATP pyrophosphohydrolase